MDAALPHIGKTKDKDQAQAGYTEILILLKYDGSGASSDCYRFGPSS
jgi:hypothetical protein